LSLTVSLVWALTYKKAGHLKMFEIARFFLYTTTGDFGKGYNAISLDRTTTSLGAGLNANGVLYYKLETTTDSATKKMIQTSK